MRRFARIAAGLMGGVVLGIFFHYLLYRIALPMEPFIYFSF
jgi:F0F1-type ATP synthase assembly protein I